MKKTRNFGDSPGSRVANDLCRRISTQAEKLFFERDRDAFQAFRARASERQSHGFFFSSLWDTVKSNEKSFALVECPVWRTDKQSLGRLDYLVLYRDWLFLIELKAMSVGLFGQTEERTNVRAAMESARDQLDNIDLEQNKAWINRLKETRVIRGIHKIPAVLVWYSATSKIGTQNRRAQAVSNADLEKIHKRLGAGPCSDALFSALAIPRSLASSPGTTLHNNRNVYVYGLGLFFGHTELPTE